MANTNTQQPYVRLKPEQDFYNIFPNGLIPVLVDKTTMLKTKDGMQPMFLMNIEEIDKEQFNELTSRLAQRYHITTQEVIADIEHRGTVPIRPCHTTGEVIYQGIQ